LPGIEIFLVELIDGIIDAVDAYCETIAFNNSQITALFETAASLDLPVKLHADQLSDSGGAELAANFVFEVVCCKSLLNLRLHRVASIHHSDHK
jgi:imidazolonepropionase-like amidohydrolase